jgi:ABC-type transport system involved in multi-copper enzyme maturation permease subunit
MPIRWGLGPVFAREALVASRRRRLYAGRSLFVLALLAAMTVIWTANVRGPAAGATPRPLAMPATAPLDGDEVAAVPSARLAATVGKSFFYTLSTLQLALILLAAPAATAGALGMERARGNLLQMLVTDLSDAEIVLGTLAARLAPVLSLIACAVPVTALAALLGGIDFSALLAVLVVSVPLALLACALTLCVSVWVARAHEVLTAVYMAEAAWLIAAPFWDSLGSLGLGPTPAWLWKANPWVLAFAPYGEPGYAGVVDYAAFVTGMLLVSAALLGVTMAQLRRVAGRGEQVAPAPIARRTWSALARIEPSLDASPVLWREWHHARPSRLARRLWIIVLGVSWSLAIAGSWRALARGTVDEVESFTASVDLLVAFGLLMVSAAAPTALAEERSRGSLDVLSATPLTAREILAGKWWGQYRQVLAILPLIVYIAGVLAIAAPDAPAIPPGMGGASPPPPLTLSDRILATILSPADFLASGASLVSLGLLLAVWVRRLGRAVAVSVILYILLAFVWPMVVGLSVVFVLEPLLGGPPFAARLFDSHLTSWLEALSPANAGMVLNQVYQWYRDPSPWSLPVLGAIVAVKLAVARLLFGLSVRTFDRRMGRMSDATAGRGGGSALERGCGPSAALPLPPSLSATPA